MSLQETSILRIRTEQLVPANWRIKRILSTWTVPNNDGGTGVHYEYDVEVEEVGVEQP